MVTERLISAIWILVLIYLAYRFILSKKKGYNSYNPDDKIDEIIRSEKYKVKGQHD